MQPSLISGYYFRRNMHLDDRVSIETYYGKAIVHTVRTDACREVIRQNKRNKKPQCSGLELALPPRY